MSASRNSSPPRMPPKTEEELRSSAEISAIFAEMIREQRQRNLDSAVLLAQQAARGHGDLIDHFCELGRRFGETLSKPKRGKLRVIEGDKP
jgi:hypothetical protein